MPRRKPKGDEQLTNNDVVLALPPAKPHRRHAHDEDPYESPPGAVPSATISRRPISRKLTPAEEQDRRALAQDQKYRALRYQRYLRALARHEGDVIEALAEVYEMTVGEVRLREDELQADVAANIGTFDLDDLAKRYNVTLEARVARLAEQFWGRNDAASIKSNEMLGELLGSRRDEGSFDAYIRTIAMQKNK